MQEKWLGQKAILFSGHVLCVSLRRGTKKIEAPVQRCLRRDLSVGEVAELHRIPTHILVRTLQEAHSDA
jgi:hypothetical protein